MKPSRKIFTIILLLMVSLIGLFLTGVLQKLLADAGRKRIEMVEKKYEDNCDLDLDFNRTLDAYTMWDEDYFDFVDEMNKKDAGKFLRWAASLDNICLKGKQAADLRLEFLYHHGISHPDSAGMWVDIMAWSVGQDNSTDVTVTLGYAFFHLFNNEYMKLTGDTQPHPMFEKLRPRVERFMQSRVPTIGFPKKDANGFYDFGDPDASRGYCSDLKRGLIPLKRRHKFISDMGMDRWFDITKHAW